MKKERLFFILIVCFIFFISSVSGESVSLSSGVVKISSADDLYAYEVNLDYTGSVTSVAMGNFLGAGTSSGYTTKNNILSVYETKLDNTAVGIDGSGTLFTATVTGSLGLESVILIANDTTETIINYACGNGVCTSSESCSTCASDCGACEEEVGGGGGGGGGGGATRTAPLPEEGINLDTNTIIIYLVLNSNKERIIKINNLGDKEKTINLRQFGLSDFVIFDEDFFTLAPGKSKNVRVRFLSGQETGIFTGKLFIGGVPVLVSINVATKELLFDALVTIPENQKQIKFGKSLDIQVTLIPMGEEPRVDVTLNYIVKDFEGKVFLSESETILVEEQRTFEKEFFTNKLPVGNYIVGLELIYPNGVATSSSHFEIVKSEIDFRAIMVLLIIGILLITAVIIFLLLRRKKSRGKKKK